MADVSKIKLPSGNEYNIKDARITGVDSAPTSGSTNVVTSGGIYSYFNSNQYEANLKWGGKNHVASFGPVDASMIPELGANRLAFLNPSTTAIEYSKDGGSTWIDYDATDAQKITLVSGLNGSFVIGKSTSTQVANANDKLRITIEANGLYTTLNKFAIFVSTNGSTGCTCTVMSRTRANYDNNTDTWVTLAENVSVGGWSGWNIINIPSVTFGNNTSHYRQIRFIFGATGHSGGSYPGLTIINILGFGGQGWTTPSTMAKNGHLYSYDFSQNAFFPAKITADSFIKSGGTSSQFLKADGSVDSNTYLTSHQSLSNYVKIDPGAAEQTIKSGIGSLNKGVINLYRRTGDNYTFLGFSNGTTEKYLGGIGFKSQADHELYLKLASSTNTPSDTYYKILNENNHAAPGVTAGTAGTSSATSGATLAVPYVTVNSAGHVTGYGTHTHTISGFSTTDTKNTTGSTDTSSKIFLVGATTQAANPQTYSDNEIYATSGVLTTKSVQVGGTAATMQYNSTDSSIEFVFS